MVATLVNLAHKEQTAFIDGDFQLTENERGIHRVFKVREAWLDEGEDKNFYNSNCNDSPRLWTRLLSGAGWRIATLEK